MYNGNKNCITIFLEKLTCIRLPVTLRRIVHGGAVAAARLRMFTVRARTVPRQADEERTFNLKKKFSRVPGERDEERT